MFAIFTVEFVYRLTYAVCQFRGSLQRQFIISFHEYRYLAEVQFTLHRESLHRIQYTIMQRHALKDIHWHRSRRMQENSLLATFAYLRNEIRDNSIRKGYDIHIRHIVELQNIRRRRSTSQSSQILGRFHGSAVHLHYIVTCMHQSRRQVMSQTSRTYKYYFHLLIDL